VCSLVYALGVLCGALVLSCCRIHLSYSHSCIILFLSFSLSLFLSLSLSFSLQGEGGGKSAGVILSTDGLNFVDFGHVHINDIARKKIVIHNAGKFNTDFTFTRPTNPQVKISPRTGTVKIGERFPCELTFHPITTAPVSNLTLAVTVAGTHSYDMSVSGVGAKPMLDFSFVQYDFGPCFVPVRGAAPMQEHAVLRITNNEFDKDVR
jgi:hypothetical protein